MPKKHIITIAGKPGSGKSTTSKMLASSLGYKHFSSGDLFRRIAKERGVDVYQINLIAEKERDIDHQVDKKLQEIGENENELVIDSRMAWHWMPKSFKVYLDLDLEIAATRILTTMDDNRKKSESIPDKPSEYAGRLQLRLDTENKRYMSLYNQNPHDISNYDLVVDTYKNNPAQVLEIILSSYKDWQNT